jgi:metal-responsive CopG/Arc/MetJ family transcriptional regulator
MGRPKMDVKPTLIRLPEGMAKEIDKIAGPGKRADFIRQAIEREIKRRGRQK